MKQLFADKTSIILTAFTRVLGDIGDTVPLAQERSAQT